jgi:hypothetical protein
LLRAGAERLAQSVPVDIRGSFGPSASSINGIYEPTNEVSGGWPVYRKQGDPDKWLEYIVATGEWYVKPTADRGRAEGWMCLAADPGCRPELCRGTCEVWDGERWTIQSTVTVLTASSGFESLLDVQIFCARELRGLQERLGNTMKRSLHILGTVSEERDRHGNLQLDQIIEDMDNQLKKLVETKAKEQSSSSASMGGSGSHPEGAGDHLPNSIKATINNSHHQMNHNQRTHREAMQNHHQSMLSNGSLHHSYNGNVTGTFEDGGDGADDEDDDAQSETDMDPSQFSSDEDDDDLDDDDDEDDSDFVENYEYMQNSAAEQEERFQQKLRRDCAIINAGKTDSLQRNAKPVANQVNTSNGNPNINANDKEAVPQVNVNAGKKGGKHTSNGSKVSGR